MPWVVVEQYDMLPMKDEVISSAGLIIGTFPSRRLAHRYLNWLMNQDGPLKPTSSQVVQLLSVPKEYVAG